MPKQEKLNNPEDNQEETPEQKEMSDQLKKMAEGIENDNTKESPKNESPEEKRRREKWEDDQRRMIKDKHDAEMARIRAETDAMQENHGQNVLEKNLNMTNEMIENSHRRIHENLGFITHGKTADKKKK